MGRTVDLDDEQWQVIGVVGDIRSGVSAVPARCRRCIGR